MPFLRPSLIALVIVFMTIGLSSVQSGLASDNLPRSSRIGPLGLSLGSYEPIPIGTVLAHPDRYQMREIRLSGAVTAIQAEIITNRLICGRAHERTMLTVEDDSGTINVIDQGACGRNIGVLKAPMVKVGQQIDLLVLVMLVTDAERSEPSLEVTLRFLDIPRH